MVTARQSLIRLFVATLLLGLCPLMIAPQAAQAGSVGFGVDSGSGFGRVIVPYDPKLDVGDGAFNLEMWVQEGEADRTRQYVATFWSSTSARTYEDQIPSSFAWGLGFDGSNFFVTDRVNQNRQIPAGVWDGPDGTGLEDTSTSNQLTYKEIYDSFALHAWHHIALSKTGVGGTLSMYLDGVRVLYIPSDNNTYSLNHGDPIPGGQGDVVIGGNKFVGQIADVRLVKGQALYTGPSITVPTSQITTSSQGADPSNVSLLLKAGGASCAIEDFSDNHFSVSVDGATCSLALSRPLAYTVAFDNQGHGTKPADQVDVIFIPFENLPAESSTVGNFSFKGWSETTTGSVLTETYTPTMDSTLYAIWQNNAETFTVMYDLNYFGSGPVPTHIPVAQGDSFTVASNPIRLGYQFMGWTDNGTNGNVYGGPSTGVKTNYTMGTSNVTLTANWESLAHPITRNVQHNFTSGHVLSTYFGGSRHTGTDVAAGWCAIAGPNVDPATWIIRSVSHDEQWEVFIFPDSITVTAGGFFSLSPDPSISFSTGETQTVSAGKAITNTSTSNSGCGANKYSISPELPSGLFLDTTTGVISGSSTLAQSRTPYTLTAERWVDANGNLDTEGTKIGYSSAVFNLEVLALHTVTYFGGSGSTGNAPAQLIVATDDTFTVAANTFSKLGYTFSHWVIGEN
ncbi:MAG: hypothetical protein F2814_03275, partial [Actinobacteria bacterium]|nr:hypothetical protein [Actinomycetota bacterium]